MLEGICVKTAMASPGIMIAIKDLLDRKFLQRSILQEVVTSNGIDSRVGPGGAAGGKIVLDGSDSTLLEPVDVVGDVISVQSSVVMSHVIMVLELVNNAVAEELGTLIISPIGVSIVPGEIGVKLFVVLGDELLGLAEL